MMSSSPIPCTFLYDWFFGVHVHPTLYFFLGHQKVLLTEPTMRCASWTLACAGRDLDPPTLLSLLVAISDMPPAMSPGQLDEPSGEDCRVSEHDFHHVSTMRTTVKRSNLDMLEPKRSVLCCSATWHGDHRVCRLVGYIW